EKCEKEEVMALVPPVTRRIMAGDLNEMFNSLIQQINVALGGSGGGGLGAPPLCGAQPVSLPTAATAGVLSKAGTSTCLLIGSRHEFLGGFGVREFDCVERNDACGKYYDADTSDIWMR